MSDVLHHARLTPTLSGIANQRAGFLARINAQAAALKPMPAIIWPGDDVAFGPIIPPFRNPPPVPFRRRVMVRQIQTLIAAKYGMEREDVMCGKRVAHYVRVRQIAVYVAHAVTKHSLPELGRCFGYSDHTSIHHALKKLNRWRREDSSIDTELNELIAECSAL